MKKRIIAALTALVMVVTMIPVSAFAQSAEPYEVVEQMISYAVDENARTVDYTKIDAVKSARAAYDALGTETVMSKVSNRDYLFAAEKAVIALNEKVAAFNAEAAKVKPGTVKGSDVPSVANSLNNLYAGIVNPNQVTGTSGTVIITMTGLSANEVKVLGEYNVGLVKALIDETFQNAAVWVEKITDELVTAEKLDTINAKNYNSADYGSNPTVGYANVINNYMPAPEKAAYLNVVINYDNYMKVNNAIAVYSDLKEDITAVRGELVKGDTLAEVEAMAKASKADYDKFAKALKDAEAIVAKYGKALVPDYGTTVTYDEFYKSYVAASKANKQFVAQSDVKAKVLALPEVKDIAGYDIDKLVAVYADITAIDEAIAATGSTKIEDLHLGTDINKKFNEVKKAAEDRMASLSKDVVDTYAKKLNAAIAALKDPNKNTRSDIDAVNAAIKVLNEYVTVSKSAINKVATIPVRTDSTDVFVTAKATALSKTALDADAKFKATLAELDANAWNKLVACTEVIINLAKEDMKAAGEAVNILKTNESVIAVGTIVNEDKALEAKAVIEKFEKAYNALNADAKADFDAADKRYTETDYTVNKMSATKAVAAAKEEIAKYVYDDATLKAIADAKAIMNSFIGDVEDDAINAEDTKLLEKLCGQIVAVEAILKDATVKRHFEQKEADLYQAYQDRKTLVEKYVAVSSAVVATENVIEKLVVFDEDKLPNVTKAETDASIAAYENAVKVYEALTVVEQAKVKNAAKLDVVKKNIEDAIKVVFEREVAAIGNITSKLTDDQVAQIVKCNALTKEYAKYVDNLADNATLKAANVALERDEMDTAKKEYLAVKPDLLNAYLYYNNNQLSVDKVSAPIIIKAVDGMKSISDAAMAYFVENESSTLKAAYDAMVAKYDQAKALLLEYATIETIADQDFTGAAVMPTVVVRDANGKIVESKEYTVSYSNNVNPGVAKVVVTAKADAKVAGSVTAEFKIIAPEMDVNVTDVLVNDGKIRVKFDAVDVAGVKYEVAYKETNLGADAEYKTIVTTDTNILIDNLDRNTKYTVKVRAVVGDYAADWSELNWAIATKGGKYVLPQADAPTVLTNTGKLRVKSDIAGIDGDVKVQVYYKKTSEPSSAYKFVNGDDNVLIEKLAKNTQYSVKVRYYIKDVKGEKAFGKFSPIVHATTR